MSIHTPARDWFKAPSGTERTWIGLALSWCVVLTLAMPYWHFKGKQNSTGEAYSVEPAKFSARVNQFVDSNQVGEVAGVPMADPVMVTEALPWFSRRRAMPKSSTLMIPPWVTKRFAGLMTRWMMPFA